MINIHIVLGKNRNKICVLSLWNPDNPTLETQCIWTNIGTFTQKFFNGSQDHLHWKSDGPPDYLMATGHGTIAYFDPWISGNINTCIKY